MKNKKRHLLILVALSLFASMRLYGQELNEQRGNISSGGTPEEPFIPKDPFRYNCTVNWIIDLDNITIASTASFQLHNQQVGVNAKDLKWWTGRSLSLDPFQRVEPELEGNYAVAVGTVVPYMIGLIFDRYAGKPVVSLRLVYGVRKAPSHQTVETSTTNEVSDQYLRVSGVVRNNGRGESQLPHVFGVTCEKIR